MRNVLLAILATALPLVAAGAETMDSPAIGTPAVAKPATVNALLGCWQGTQVPDMCVLFQTDELYLHQQGRTVMGTVTYANGSFDLGMMGQTARIPYTISGDALVLMVSGQRVAFKRIATIPASISDALHPLALGSAKPDAARIAAIKAELAKRLVEDQAVRTDPSRSKDMGRVDSDDTAYIRALAIDVGWIDVDRFGDQASNAAFLLVQHSGDMPLMQAVLPEIEKDLKAKKLHDGQPFALLYDRTQLYLGKPQRYGSQLVTNERKELVVYSLEDPAGVDRRRAAIGMEPLAAYLKSFKAANGGKDVSIPTK